MPDLTNIENLELWREVKLLEKVLYNQKKGFCECNLPDDLKRACDAIDRIIEILEDK